MRRVADRSGRRADAGSFRLNPKVQAELARLLTAPEPLSMPLVMRRLRDFCRRYELPVPSRAVLYRARRLLPLRPFPMSSLPGHVRRSLYNLNDSALVPGEQLVFYAFNYGDTAAMSFAAGLPVVWLERAERLRGWRPKSRSLLESVVLRRRRQRAAVSAD